MAEKREQIKIGKMKTRKTRMTRSRLDCLNPNPDRGISHPVATPINRDIIEYHPQVHMGGPESSEMVSPLDEIPDPIVRE
jgi:hypothetical protein